MHFCGFSQHSFIHYFFFPSTWGVTIHESLLMGSLSLWTIVNMGQRFYSFFKGYVVNSCLNPPLNPNSEAVSHSATCSTNLL